MDFKEASVEAEVDSHSLCLTMFHHPQVLIREGAEVLEEEVHHAPEVQEEGEDVVVHQTQMPTQTHQPLLSPQLQTLSRNIPAAKPDWMYELPRFKHP